MAVKNNDPRLTRAYKAQRLKVLHRDNWICYYCGGDATQADHVIPISKGGDAMDLDNMVAACKRCNVAKGARSQGFFLTLSATPPVFDSFSPRETTSTTQSGPCLGQPTQKQTG
jgi:5-methylcytosine-specific restriction endonuclease McrA